MWHLFTFYGSSFYYLCILSSKYLWSSFLFLNFQDGKAASSSDTSFQDSNKDFGKTYGNGTVANSSNSQSAATPRTVSFSSGQLLSQRKLFSESQLGRSSFQKLLEPSLPQRPGIAPYRIVLGNVKDKVILSYLGTPIINMWSLVTW